MTLSRYWHTLRHLRASQVLGRLWFRVYRPAVDLRPAPVQRTPARPWQSLGWRTPCLLDAGTLRCLGVTGDLESPHVWHDDRHGRLWLYNLHYFDDLTSRAAEDRLVWHQALIDRWIAENPPAIGPGWEPYPTSLRIVNWIKWLLASPPTAEVAATMRQSLAVQTRWLGRRLEVHLLANHLWANAKALVMAGVFCDGPEAGQWRDSGLRLLLRELDEQVLPDGGHIERSPMYHAIVLEDVLDVLQMAEVCPGGLPAAVTGRLTEVAARMLRWLRVMSHPDGDIAFFNDAAFDIAAPLAELERYARTLDVPVDQQPLGPVVVLPDSGYIRMQTDRAVVICDVAPVGPDYQPGHAHADTLSCEVSLDGARVVVNGGTSTYTPGAERARQRGTAAHSTVAVDGWDSSDVWGAFRVGRRARPFDVHTGVSEDGPWAEGAHDGYRHRPGRVVHRRRWTLDDSGLTVTDALEGTFARAVARFILHPAAAAGDTAPVRFTSARHGVLATVETEWHPRFGEAHVTRACDAVFTLSPCVTRLSWT